MIAPDAFTYVWAMRPEYPLTPTTPSYHWLWDGKAAGVCVFILWHQTHTQTVCTRLTAPSPIGSSLSVTSMLINTVRMSQSAQMALLERMCRGIICHLPTILGHGKGISKACAISANKAAWGGKHRHALWWPVHVFTPPTCDCDPEFNKTVRKCLSAYLTIIGMT